ncbi:hypothetical protein RLOC_00005781 [Lonchura striata]|uniref:Uncharacterized protein n=1 Tax=Lonchura striata TaxID=40157 RepID=A0A218V730_9PASE|nr:hypothetical protein RLOC_00005781 [Lonchura striata domestica]
MCTQLLLNRLLNLDRITTLNSGEQLFLLITVIKTCKLGNTVSHKCLLNTHWHHHPQYYSDIIILSLQCLLNRHLLIASQRKLINPSMNVLETNILK